jgi:hypothetical protein
MPGSDADRTEWVRRVLGVVVGATSGAQADSVQGASPAARLAALEPKYQAALRAVPAERSGLVAAWESAAERAGGPDVRAAGAAIDRLAAQIEELLVRPAASDADKFGIRSGIVAERQAELEAYFSSQIAAAKSETGGEIGKLTRALGAFIEEPEALVAAVRREISGLLDQLQEELDESLEKGREEDVGEILAVWHERIETAPVATALRQVCSDLGVTVAVDTVIGAMADDIMRKLNFEPA